LKFWIGFGIDDEIAPARISNQFAKINENFKILGGIFENRFSYVEELQKLGAKIEFISPKVENPNEFYFFNHDRSKEYTQA